MSLLRVGISLTLLASGIMHFAQVRSHLDESAVSGSFFAVVAALQVVLAGTLLVPESRRAQMAAIVLTVGVLAVWLVSRTVGVPIGPHAGVSEPIAVADAVTTGLELVSVLLLAALVRIRRRPCPRPRMLDRPDSPRGPAFAGGILISVAIAGLTSVALRPVPSHGHDAARDPAPAMTAPVDPVDLLDHHASDETNHTSADH